MENSISQYCKYWIIGFVLILGTIGVNRITLSYDHPPRCTYSDERYFLGEHTYPSTEPDQICTSRVGSAQPLWNSFITGTDMGNSVHNIDLGIHHFYMGDTWGIGENKNNCSDGPEFSCDAYALRNDTLGWILDTDPIMNTPQTGIDIQMRHKAGYPNQMNGFGIKGIPSMHSD